MACDARMAPLPTNGLPTDACQSTCEPTPLPTDGLAPRGLPSARDRTRPGSDTADHTLRSDNSFYDGASGSGGSSGSSGGSVMVGTLNCLGEAYNPFEFLAASNSASCEQLMATARALPLSALDSSGALGTPPTGGEAVLSRLREHVAAGRAVWDFFDEATLAHDNRLLEARVNLLTFAMRPHGPDGAPLWQRWRTWVSELQAVAQSSPSYVSDANLWLWDLTCCVVASSEAEAYESVCLTSHLNPTSLDVHAACFFDRALAAAGESTPVVIGMQEYPRAATPKGEAYARALEARGLCVLRGEVANANGVAVTNGVAVVYSAALGDPTALDCTALAHAAMATCLEEAEGRGEGIASDVRWREDRKGLVGTTAARVLACRFPNASRAREHTFVVMHAKEPKTPNGARVLAAFVGALAKALNAPPKRFVLVSDTNLGSAALASAFASRLGEDGYSAAPGPDVDTTAKQRSILHGQCYDTKKCLALVSAPKDKIVAMEGRLSEWSTWPVVADLGGTGLPSASWPSDHCLTHARLAVEDGSPALQGEPGVTEDGSPALQGEPGVTEDGSPSVGAHARAASGDELGNTRSAPVRFVPNEASGPCASHGLGGERTLPPTPLVRPHGPSSSSPSTPPAPFATVDSALAACATRKGSVTQRLVASALAPTNAPSFASSMSTASSEGRRASTGFSRRCSTSLNMRRVFGASQFTQRTTSAVAARRSPQRLRPDNHLHLPTLLRRPSVDLPEGCAPDVKRNSSTRRRAKATSWAPSAALSRVSTAERRSSAEGGSGGRAPLGRSVTSPSCSGTPSPLCRSLTRQFTFNGRGHLDARQHRDDVEQPPSASRSRLARQPTSGSARFSLFYSSRDSSVGNVDEYDRYSTVSTCGNLSPGSSSPGRFQHRASSDAGSVHSLAPHVPSTSSASATFRSTALAHTVGLTAVESESVSLAPFTLHFRDHAASAGDQTASILSSVIEHTAPSVSAAKPSRCSRFFPTSLTMPSSRGTRRMSSSDSRRSSTASIAPKAARESSLPDESRERASLGEETDTVADADTAACGNPPSQLTSASHRRGSALAINGPRRGSALVVTPPSSVPETAALTSTPEGEMTELPLAQSSVNTSPPSRFSVRSHSTAGPSIETETAAASAAGAAAPKPAASSTSFMRRLSGVGTPASAPPAADDPFRARAPTPTPVRGVGSRGLDFSKGVSGTVLEERFQSFTLPARLVHHRLGLAVTATVMFWVGLVDVYRVLSTLGRPYCAPLCLPHARLPLVLVEMGASFFCVLAFLLTLQVGALPIMPVGALPIMPVGALPIMPVDALPIMPVGALPIMPVPDLTNRPPMAVSEHASDLPPLLQPSPASCGPLSPRAYPPPTLPTPQVAFMPSLAKLALRVVVFGYILVGISIAIASVTFDQMFAIRISTSLMILFYALVGNVSGMRFLHVLLVCTLGAGAYAARLAANLGYFGDTYRSLWHLLVAYEDEPPPGTPRPVLPSGEQLSRIDLIECLLWVCTAIVGSLSSSYAQESYERRRFVLVQRLQHETERVDAFLYRMLPPTVVAQMKRGFHVADEFDDVFILASDIVGFTKLSAASKPSEVMHLLSQLFSKFDDFSESLGVYKVQTIGDAYIAVSGIFGSQGNDDEDDAVQTSEGRARRRKQNARAIVEFATAMIDTIKTVQVPPGAPGPLNMRIGIHVGNLTAGVIGMKRLRYDIWGSAVLAATALESNGVPGEVCVSEEVMRHLDGAYDFQKHEVVQLKAALKDGATEVTSYKLLRPSKRRPSTLEGAADGAANGGGPPA